MADSTARFKLTTFDQPTDRVDYADYKFTNADRVLLDRLLRFVTENHVHTGGDVAHGAAPAPTLAPQRDGGAMPANLAAYYCYSIVDARGQETVASQVATAFTPSQVPAPLSPPTLAPTASGTLDGGDYLYAVAACTNDTRQETLPSPTATGTLSSFGGWTITLPRMPSGGDFFNIYRKGPRDDELVYLTSSHAYDTIAVDDGSIAANRLRHAPISNSTFSTNGINVTLPTPTPEGTWTWRLYRTYDSSQWENSLLDWIGPDGTYFDDGRATRPGMPPSASAAIGGAPKIRLDSEAEGVLPPRSVTFSRITNFTVDHVVEGPGAWFWLNEYDTADLRSMRATLGRNCPPASQEVQVGLDFLRPIIGWAPVKGPFSPDRLVSVIAVGETIGTYIDLSMAVPEPLTQGQGLRMYVEQAGGGATPTDRNLALTVTLAVRHGSATQSYEWETA